MATLIEKIWTRKQMTMSHRWARTLESREMQMKPMAAKLSPIIPRGINWASHGGPHGRDRQLHLSTFQRSTFSVRQNLTLNCAMSLSFLNLLFCELVSEIVHVCKSLAYLGEEARLVRIYEDSLTRQRNWFLSELQGHLVLGKGMPWKMATSQNTTFDSLQASEGCILTLLNLLPGRREREPNLRTP